VASMATQRQHFCLCFCFDHRLICSVTAMISVNLAIHEMRCEDQHLAIDIGTVAQLQFPDR